MRAMALSSTLDEMGATVERFWPIRGHKDRIQLMFSVAGSVQGGFCFRIAFRARSAFLPVLARSPPMIIRGLGADGPIGDGVEGLGVPGRYSASLQRFARDGCRRA